jgi:hypothetical protein
MNKVAARLVTWSIGGSVGAVVLAVTFLAWLEGKPDDGGPGVGLGLVLLTGTVLLTCLCCVIAGTAMLGFSRMQQRGWGIPSHSHAFYAGVTFSVLGASFAVLALL